MKRLRNDTYFAVLDSVQMYQLGTLIVQAEFLGIPEKDLFLCEVMYEKV